jgi:hypothetical protein
LFVNFSVPGEPRVGLFTVEQQLLAINLDGRAIEITGWDPNFAILKRLVSRGSFCRHARCFELFPEKAEQGIRRFVRMRLRISHHRKDEWLVRPAWIAREILSYPRPEDIMYFTTHFDLLWSVAIVR